MNLAISRPMPLVDPVTMQVRLLTGGRGMGLCKWEAMILWNSISCIRHSHPLIHSIQPRPSFFFSFFPSCCDDDDDASSPEDDVVPISLWDLCAGVGGESVVAAAWSLFYFDFCIVLAIGDSLTQFWVSNICLLFVCQRSAAI